MDIVAFENDLKRIKDIIRGRAEINLNLLGCEPLLNPDLIKFFEIARSIFADEKIILITNGLLLPRQKEEFWQKCAERDVTISVTYYPALTEADCTLIEQNAKHYGNSLVMTNRTQELGRPFYWMKMPLDLNGKQNPGISYFFCPNRCNQIWHGKLYPCHCIAYIDDFNRAFNQNLEVTRGDYLDIHSTTTYEELEAFRKGPWPFCRYCKTAKLHLIPWRHGGEKRLDDWT